MKLITGTTNGQTVAGWVDGDAVVVCATGAEAAGAVLRLIAGGEAARADWGRAGGEGGGEAGGRVLRCLRDLRGVAAV